MSPSSQSKSRPRQMSFFKAPSLEHGGDLRRGRRKIARPFDPKRPLHVVLHSEQARGKWSFLHQEHKLKIERFIYSLSDKWGVKIYEYANVGNHLHLLVQAKTKS